MFARDYRYSYTFRDILGEHGISHADGRVSVAIEFYGLDFEYLDAAAANQKLQSLYSLIGGLDLDLELEVHLFRREDSSKAEEYLAENQKLERAVDICAKVRTDIADHIGHLGKSNKIIVVLSKRCTGWHGNTNPIKTLLSNIHRSFNVKKDLTRQNEIYNQLVKQALDLSKQLGGDLLSAQEFVDIVFSAIDNSYTGHYDITNPNNYLYLPEIAIADKPVFEDGVVKYSNHYHKILVAANYPSIDAGWLSDISFLDCDLHYSLFLQRLEKGSVIRKSESKTRRLEGANTPSASSLLSIRDNEEFRQYVLENELAVFSNTLVLRISSESLDAVLENAQVVQEHFELSGGSIRSNKYIQQGYFRLQTPTQLSTASHKRVDHQELIANLLPVAVAGTGDDRSQVLRLSENNTLIGLNFRAGGLHHGFTVGRSRCGKDVETQAQIFETFGLGYNWFILEIDPSYQFTVETLGGNYLDVDPSHDNINPFPVSSEIPDQELIDCTLSALAPLILDKQDITDAERGVMEQAFCSMYSLSNKPNLQDFFTSLTALDQSTFNDLQRKAHIDISQKLEALLATNAGKIFASEDNFQLSNNICGVNFRKIKDTGNRKAATFYLIFIILRFSQIAESSGKPSFIVLNEIHEFSAYAPEVIKDLIRSVTRMGGKRGVYLKIVTQNIEDINLGDGVLGQMNNKQFVYMSEGHELVQDRLPDLPDYAVDSWKSMHHPDELAGKNFRQQFWNIGNSYYLLHVTLPEDLVLLANTDPAVMRLKREISKLSMTPIEKLEKLKERLANA